MADRMRFELTVRVNVHTLSRRAPSTTRPPVRTALPLGTASWFRYLSSRRTGWHLSHLLARQRVRSNTA
jgi:hypothetical protein